MKEAKLYIGTSGWTYDHWKGVFYPETLSSRLWLEYYCRQFDAVELNASFYRIPKVAVVEGWNKRTPEGFCFAVKVSRLISHMKRLKNCDHEMEWFFSTFKPLEPKIGVFLVQLPPSLKCDPCLIESFSSHLPPKIPFAFEFRNKSWYNDETYDVLRKNHLAFCIHDMQGCPTDRTVTADTVYVRFHGCGARYGGDYPEEVLADWAVWIREQRNEAQRIFCFFNNDFQGFAVKNSLRLRELVG